jgi:flagellar motor switch protein FliN
MDEISDSNPFGQVPITLDRRVDDPVELYVGDRLIARGELQEVEGDSTGQLAVRLTEVANLRGGL